MQLINLSILSIIGLASASTINKRSTRGDSTTVKVVNDCAVTIQVGQSTNGQQAGLPAPLSSGRTKSYTFQGTWSGRFWARENCSGSGCPGSSAAVPASLAEFTFLAGGSSGLDYYDVSFVDGYNLPISITPVNAVDPTSSSSSNWCTTPKCNPLPACPSEFQLYDSNGNYEACLSACSKFGSSQYCCTGANDTPATCPINSYAQAVKDVCPDVYSYAYDDQTSTYACSAPNYTVTFCPN